MTRNRPIAPRCDGGNCRLASGHLGRCALTVFGAAVRRMREELANALFADGPRPVRMVSLAEVVGPDNAILRRLRCRA